MKKSAMLQAFQALGRKPMLFLLLLPVQLVGVLAALCMPDVSKMLDWNNLAYMDMQYVRVMEYNVLIMLVNSLSFIVGLGSIFLLVPPAVELLRDGAAGIETKPGWYTRGIASHWWKPVVTSLITGAAYAIVSIPVIVAMMASFFMRSFSFAGDPNLYISPYMPPNEAINEIMGKYMPGMLGQFAVFCAVIGVLSLIVYSMLGMMLPALADRKFGAAFKLMFSRKGFRNLPRMAGGLLLLNVVPLAVYIALGALYFLMNGWPQDFFGYLTGLFGFMKSWEGILGLLLMAVFPVLTYAFQFSVYQQVADEERAALPQ